MNAEWRVSGQPVDNQEDTPDLHFRWSGRGDLNPRPQRPERCALTKLRYFPVHLMLVDGSQSREAVPAAPAAGASSPGRRVPYPLLGHVLTFGRPTTPQVAGVPKVVKKAKSRENACPPRRRRPRQGPAPLPRPERRVARRPPAATVVPAPAPPPTPGPGRPRSGAPRSAVRTGTPAASRPSGTLTAGWPVKLRSGVLTAMAASSCTSPALVGRGPSGGQLTALTVGTTRTESVAEQLVEAGRHLVAEPLGGDVVRRR